MKCPSCGSERVFHSRARTIRDQLVKRTLPVTFYRCHDCNWRRARMIRDGKRLVLHALSFVGYGAAVVLLLVIVMATVAAVLTLTGLPVPWLH